MHLVKNIKMHLILRLSHIIDILNFFSKENCEKKIHLKLHQFLLARTKKMGKFSREEEGKGRRKTIS